MNTPWLLFLAALRFMTRRAPSRDDASRPMPHAATRFFPLIGILSGLLAGGIYWLGAQLWPTSVAVVLCMAATSLAATSPVAGEARGARLGAAYGMLSLLVKYNALMALTAATGPIPLPPYLTLGLVMIAGQAAAGGLVVSLLTGGTSVAPRATTGDLGVALLIGFLPATLLGIPGLAGLVSAIVLRLILTAVVLPRTALEPRLQLDVTQQMTEVSFYLGAVATWRYV